MVKYDDTRLSHTFMALSDATRRAILARLAHGDALVTELATPFDISLPAVSKHLGVLERAGLIQRKKDGRIRRCRLDAAPLKDAADWISYYKQFWDTRLESLAQYLDELNNKENPDGTR